MSISISEDEFDMGIAMLHDRLRDAIKAYNDYLVTYGTCPDMTLVDELEKTADRILTHDREYDTNKTVGSFRYEVKCEVCPECGNKNIACSICTEKVTP